MKKYIKSKYSLVIFVFIVFVFFICFTYLELNYKIKGTGNIKNNYYDINFNNVMIDYETSTTVKIDNDNNTLSIKVNDLDKYTKGNSISVEMYNIGSIDALIKNINLVNIDTNVKSENVSINLSMKNDDIFYASEKKILNILIKYNNKEKIDNAYYNFDIKFDFNELDK